MAISTVWRTKVRIAKIYATMRLSLLGTGNMTGRLGERSEVSMMG
jgi:hypothetical protein